METLQVENGSAELTADQAATTWQRQEADLTDTGCLCSHLRACVHAKGLQSRLILRGAMD